jgi:hypothetical protein
MFYFHHLFIIICISGVYVMINWVCTLTLIFLLWWMIGKKINMFFGQYEMRFFFSISVLMCCISSCMIIVNFDLDVFT